MDRGRDAVAFGVGLAELLQPVLAAGGLGDDGPVGADHDKAGRVRGVGELNTRDEKARADAFCEMRGQAPHEHDLVSRESRPGAAVQTHTAPGDAADTQYRPQLVAEPHRPRDLAVARAGVHVAAGGFGQSSHTDGIGRERRPLVHVVVEELVVDEERNGLR